jgi:23S rRNA maturation-related 3'-5' exoribonuclease YhaM
MANYTYVDSTFVLIAVEAEAELALENGFSVSAEDSELLTLTFNNRAVMFAGVYLQDDSTYEVQVEEVINEDLDTYTVELNANGNVATLQEAGAVVRKAFEEMQDKLMQDNF